MLYIPYPFKRCNRCGQEYPSTKRYFNLDRTVYCGLRACCKRCEKKRFQNYQYQNQDKIKETKSRYRQTHADQIIEYRRHYNLEHGDHRRQYARDYHKTHRVHRSEYAREYKRTHRDMANVWERNRKAQKRALLATFTADDWEFALDYFGGVCAYCGHGPSLFDRYWTLQQEHHIPASRGGNYTPDNILPACQTCNIRKNNRDPMEWLQEKFGKTKARKIAERIRIFFTLVRH